MVLSLLRDKATLAMTFVLPAAVFVIFAMIFAGAAGGDITVRMAILDQRDTPASQRLIEAIGHDPQVVAVAHGADSPAQLRALVVNGDADVGLLVRANGTGFDELEAGREAPLTVFFEPLRSISASAAQGVLQSAWAEALPDARIRMAARMIDETLVPLSGEQKEALDIGLEQVAELGGLESGALYDLREAALGGSAQASVTYYAAGVSILFLLLAALHGALSIMDDKASGLFQRQMMGPGAAGAMIDGKFLYLVMMGVLQVATIYLVAWQFFSVDLPGHVGPWLLITVAASCCTAGLALFFVSCCGTRQQAETLGHIGVLVMSALGGSMVPRFLMPLELQQLGWLTPNTWALEAFEGVFRRGESVLLLGQPLCLLLGAALLGLLGARLLVVRRG